MLELEKRAEKSGLSSVRDEIWSGLEQYQREKKEISLLLDQSQADMQKLSQRHAAITTHLQQIQNQFDSTSREDIRMIYDSALDTQQRLLVMRGQVEKLQSEQNHLIRIIEWMSKIFNLIDQGSAGGIQSSNKYLGMEAIETTIRAQEAERQRLSRQMHDGPAQTLSNFILQTEIAMRLFDLDPEKAKQELEALRTTATNSFRDIREFIFELRPMILDDLGLVPTLKRYVDSVKQQESINVLLSVTGVERRLALYEEVMIFRAIQELLRNAAQHSQAMQIQVHLDMADELVKVVVDDNGKGLDVEALSDSRGVGLKIIRDRVVLLGGEFKVDSNPGQGTRVSFFVPVIVE